MDGKRPGPTLQVVEPPTFQEAYADDPERGEQAHLASLANASQFELGEDFYKNKLHRGDAPPLYVDGQVHPYNPQSSLYQPMADVELRVQLAERYKGCKRAQKYPDVTQIARVVTDIVHLRHTRQDLPVGVASKTKFWTVGPQGLQQERLGPQHGATFALPVDPDFEAPCPLWNAFLDRACAGPEPEVRRLRMQEIYGGVLMRLLPRLQVVVLLYGPTHTGKSTFAKVLIALLPPAVVTATPPTHWPQDYKAAMLAGKALNVVGELSGHDPIPGAVFKTVVGGDPIQARLPWGIPFTYVCRASHIFLSNYFPPTDDHSPAFFRRWEIEPFFNKVAEADKREEWHEELIRREQPQILAWALRGAERLHRQQRMTPSAEHDRLMLKWRLTTSSVLEFLNDEECCALDAQSKTRQGELYQAFQDWCGKVNRSRLGRNKFFESIDLYAGVFGVVRKKASDANYVEGVRLIGSKGLW